MSKQKSRSHSLYVGNLHYKLDEDHVLGLFKKYGYIKNIKIMREGKENKSKGVAFVEMTSLEDANKAIANVNGLLHNGRTLKVSIAKTQNFKVQKKTFGPIKDPLKPEKVSDFSKKKPRRKNKRPEFSKLFS
ncbi:MAG: RNA recognition motif domain-containing protein [Bacteriovoracaceae bacterium]